MSRLLNISLAVLAVFVGKLYADPPDTLTLKEFELTAELSQLQTLASKRSIDQDVLATTSHHDLGRMLMTHSPVFFRQYGPGSLSTAAFRGTAASHTLVLWNGIPLNAPQLGQVDFSTIPVFLLDDVGLLWGTAAASLRSGGIGGIVSLGNRPDFNSGFSLSAIQSFGSFGTRGSFVSMGYGKGRIHLRTRVFRQSAVNDFPFLNTAVLPFERIFQQQAAYTDYGFLQEISVLGKKSKLNFRSWNQWNNRNLPPLMTNLERGGDPREMRNDRFSRNMLDYTLYFSSSGKIELKTAYFTEYQHYYLRTTTSVNNQIVSLIDAHNRSDAMHGILNLEQYLAKGLKLKAAMLYDSERVNSSNFEGLKGRSKLAFQTGLEYHSSGRIGAVLNTRYDLVEGKPQGFSPSVEVNYLLLSDHSLRLGAGFSRNLRYPSMNDMYWFPGGNPNLKPEESRSFDVNISHLLTINSMQWSNKFSAYYSDIQNWIQWRPTAYRYWVPANLSNVKARGLEWHSNLNGEIGLVNWKLLVNYAFTITTDESPVAKFEHSSGKQLIYIPKHNGNVHLNLQWKQWSGGWGIAHTGERNTSLNSDPFFTGRLPAYTLHSLEAGRTVSIHGFDFGLHLQIHNLFNVDYQAVLWRPMPGRFFGFIAKMNI